MNSDTYDYPVIDSDYGYITPIQYLFLGGATDKIVSPSVTDNNRLHEVNKTVFRSVFPTGFFLAGYEGLVVRCLTKKQLVNVRGMVAFKRGLLGLTKRVCRLTQFTILGDFYFDRPDITNLSCTKANKIIRNDNVLVILSLIYDVYIDEDMRNQYAENELDAQYALLLGNMRDYADDSGIGYGKVMQTLRAVLCGKMEAPELSDVMYSLGYTECLMRIATAYGVVSSRKKI